MSDILFIGIALGYFWFGSKADEWVTIAALGFKLETPEWFLANPRAYDMVRIAMFFAACACLLNTRYIPWLNGAIVLCVAWFGTTWLGQRRAFAHYRKICLECVHDHPTSEDNAYWVAEAAKSDSELREHSEIRERLLNPGRRISQKTLDQAIGLYMTVAAVMAVVLGLLVKPAITSIFAGGLAFSIGYFFLRLPQMIGTYRRDGSRILLLFLYLLIGNSVLAAIFYWVGRAVSRQFS